MAKKKLYDENGNEVKGKLKKPFYKKIWFWVLVVILIGIFGSMGSDDTTNETGNGSTTEETAEKPKNDSKTEESSTEAESEKSKEEVPREYQSALNKGESYASMMRMSKQGIYDQLTSEHGEKFSEEAAQYAIDNLEVDWKENALSKAKDYQDEMNMSPESIRDQLTSEHGEQFTQEEADYAIEHLND